MIIYIYIYIYNKLRHMAVVDIDVNHVFRGLY